ncbi:hypothetical protein B4U80_12126, partial [Leptotrombidium deliense]
IMMDPNKVTSILRMEPPTSKRDIRVFLGKIGFYSRFQKNLQIMAQPLTKRLRKDIEMGWGVEEQCAFNNLLESLAQYPILRHFDPKLSIEMRIDACGIGCGFVLGQIHSDGFHPTMYGSRQFSDREKLLPPHDQEAIGLGYACKSTESIIKGYNVTAKTDNCAVCHINKKTKLSPQMMRVALLIQEFDLKIVHKRGTHNKDADCLSRFPVNPPTNIGDNIEEQLFNITLNSSEPINVSASTLELTTTASSGTDSEVFQINGGTINLKKLQQGDSFIKSIRALLELGGDFEKREINELSKYTIIDDVLYRRSDDRNPRLLICVPKELRADVLYACHDDTTGGHMGYRKTLKKIRERCYFPGMNLYIKNYVESCRECQTKKSLPSQSAGLLCPIKVGGPFEMIGIDFLGPFPISEQGNKYLIVATDYLTKWVECKATPTCKSWEVSKFLVEQI